MLLLIDLSTLSVSSSIAILKILYSRSGCLLPKGIQLPIFAGCMDVQPIMMMLGTLDGDGIYAGNSHSSNNSFHDILV